jgi:hypothetical protein
MSTKGFNKFEQHVEKAVLGLALLVALGAVGFQFLSAPSVKVGPKSVDPGEVDALLEAKARALSSQLAEAGIQFESGAVEPAAAGFGEQLKAEVSPAKSLVATAPNFNARLLTTTGASSDQWFYVPVMPPLRMKGVDEHADALTAASAAKAKAASAVLAARPDFSGDGPKDVVWTTPYAVLDLKALRAELKRGVPDARPPLSPVPSIWYEERANPPILDIVFERRRKLPSGEWGAPEVVPAFAERAPELMLRDEIAAPPMDFRAEAFALLGVDTNQREVLQAPFYETVNGAFVSPSADAAEEGSPSPGADKAAAAEMQRRKQMRTGLDRRRQRAESLRTEIEKLGGLWDEEAEKEREKERRREEQERKDSGQGGGGGGGGLGGPGGGLGGSGAVGGKNTGTDGAAERDEQDRNRKRREKSREYRKLEAEIADLEKKLGMTVTEPGSAPKASPSLDTSDEVLVWGHDLEVEFGATYQYRCVARVLSPFFGKGNQLVKEQDSQGLAEKCTLDSAASDWSDPVTVSPRVQFFITRASLGDGPAATASVQCEVYKFEGGKWCSDDVAIQVGEQIGRPKEVSGKSVDFSTAYVLLDVIEDRNSERTSGSGGARRPAVVVIAPIGGGGPEVRVPAIDTVSSVRDRLSLKAAMIEQASEAGGKPPATDPAGGRPPGPTS